MKTSTTTSSARLIKAYMDQLAIYERMEGMTHTVESHEYGCDWNSLIHSYDNEEAELYCTMQLLTNPITGDMTLIVKNLDKKNDKYNVYQLTTKKQ